MLLDDDRSAWIALRRGAILAAVAALWGCADGPPRPTAAVRDSAGVRVVEHAGAPWERPVGLRVAPEPTLDLGTATGPVELQFDGVAAMRRLGDGRIVVADAGSSEIRVFGSDGTFIGATGRPGDGPGEFRQLVALGVGPGDSLWAFDFGLRRFAVLDGSVRFVRHVTLGPALSAVTGLGRTTAGDFLVRELWSSPGAEEVHERGLRRDPVALARLDPAATRLDTIGLFDGREVFIGTEDGRAVMGSPAFAHTLSVAFRDGRLAVGDQTAFEVRLHSADGALESRIRFPDAELERTAGDLERFIARETADLDPEEAAMLRRHFESLAAPDTRPAYGDLLIDSAGRIWVGEYAGSRPSPRYMVLDPDGAVVGLVELPPGFRPYDADEDRVLGIGRDAMGVEHVRAHRLTPP